MNGVSRKLPNRSTMMGLLEGSKSILPLPVFAGMLVFITILNVRVLIFKATVKLGNRGEYGK